MGQEGLGAPCGVGSGDHPQETPSETRSECGTIRVVLQQRAAATPCARYNLAWLREEVRRIALKTVAAEIEYRSEKKITAARALQQRGFQLLAVGTTISVQAPAELWTSTFGVSFESRTKQVAEGTTSTYLQPATDRVDIPADLRTVIAQVLFVQPPEFFAP